MDNIKEVKSDLPENFEELKKSSSRASNWRERLAAIEELGQWKSSQSITILTSLMKNDNVYKVQEAAFRKLQAFGEDVQLPSRKQGDLIEGQGGVRKVLSRIKKSLPRDHTYEEFKEKVKKMRIDIYDTYEGDKEADFDKWLETTWVSFSKK
ncbi:MAG: HEAT repeat domain-containing protein [Bacilli bacterium]